MYWLLRGYKTITYINPPVTGVRFDTGVILILKQTIIIIISSCTLLAVAFLIEPYLGLSYSLAIPSIVGAAAAVAALFNSRKKVIPPRFLISEAWVHYKSNIVEGYKLNISLTNTGSEADVLQAVEQKLYNRRLGFIRSILTCGGRPVDAARGHVIPIKCAPYVQYLIQGVATVGISAKKMKKALEPIDDQYIVKCKLIFANSRPITIRITTLGLSKKVACIHYVDELATLVKTLNRNPFGPIA